MLWGWRERSRPRVGAEIVASAHYADESAHAVASESGGDYVAVCLGAAQLHVDGFLAGFHRCEQRGQVEVAVRPGHEIDTVIGDKVVFDALGHAADHSDDQ